MKPANGIRERIIREQRIVRRVPLVNGLISYLNPLRNIAGLIMSEFRSGVNLSFRHTLRAWRSGFTRSSYRMYGMEQSGNPDDYISDYEALRQMNINGSFTEMISNKLFFSLLMKEHGIPTPKIYGVIHKGFFYSTGPEGAMGPSEFLKAVSRPGERIVLKPLRAWHGHGLLMVAQNDSGFLINGESVTLDELIGIISKIDNYLAVEFVTQGEYGALLYPHTTNTVRVITLLDSDTSAPFIARVVQRIGTSRSYPVDNFKGGRGGLSAEVDPDSGELGLAAMADDEGHLTWHSSHPETNAGIKGAVVPHWGEIRRNILEYAGRLAFVPFIAWDIVPTLSGFSIIEGNPMSGMTVIQVHGPMLADSRIRRFCRSHGVIKRQ